MRKMTNKFRYDKERIVDYVLTIMETYGYAAMFICMVLENANIPIPSEIILGFAGYLVFQGVFDLHTAIIVGVVAGIVGSILSYWMGEYGDDQCSSNMVSIFYSTKINLVWRRNYSIAMEERLCLLVDSYQGCVRLFLSQRGWRNIL